LSKAPEVLRLHGALEPELAALHERDAEGHVSRAARDPSGAPRRITGLGCARRAEGHECDDERVKLAGDDASFSGKATGSSGEYWTADFAMRASRREACPTPEVKEQKLERLLLAARQGRRAARGDRRAAGFAVAPGVYVRKGYLPAVAGEAAHSTDGSTE
jgi:hypothetical protein